MRMIMTPTPFFSFLALLGLLVIWSNNNSGTMIFTSSFTLSTNHIVRSSTRCKRSMSKRQVSLSVAAATVIDQDSTTSSTSSSFEQCIQRAKDEHKLQYENGVQTFGSSSNSSSSSATTTNSPWSSTDDKSFIKYNVKQGHGGPSESMLTNGNVIFETTQPLLNEMECQEYINAAKETIEKEKRQKEQQQRQEDDDSRSTQRSNSDLGEARLSRLPSNILEKLQSLLQTALYPILTSRFGVDDITVYDGLILGHIAPSISQPVHRDASLLTINIPLSSPTKDYNGGGGTYIEGLENHNWLPLCIEKGKAICHSSGIMHAGIGIQEGERWVMVLFVIAKNEPQIGRRLHASALYAISDNELIEAETNLKAGLDYAPKDHLLNLGLGQVAAIRAQQLNDEEDGRMDESSSSSSSQRKKEEYHQKYFNYLQKAVSHYPNSYKSSIAMGKILLEKRKPRAALRHFDQVLSIIDDRDLIDGAFMQLKAQAWDARVSAAQCTLLCMDREIAGVKKHLMERIRSNNNHVHEGSSSGGDERDNYWSNKLRLQEVISRLDIALIPTPDNQYLLSMRERAVHLLNYTEE